MSRYGIGSAGALIALFGGAFVGGAALAGATHHVSQKGREFAPERMTIARGDSVAIKNDDAGLLHHVYIDSSTLSFDSGEQRAGEVVAVAFPERGRFEVLCGIHPKMRLVVEVR